MSAPPSETASRPTWPTAGPGAPSTYRMYTQELSQTLRALRRKRGLSQEAVAHAAGLTAYTYQKFEHGESRPGTPMNPGLKTLIELSRVFGVSVTELLPAWLPDLPAYD